VPELADGTSVPLKTSYLDIGSHTLPAPAHSGQYVGLNALTARLCWLLDETTSPQHIAMRLQNNDFECAPGSQAYKGCALSAPPDPCAHLQCQQSAARSARGLQRTRNPSIVVSAQVSEPGVAGGFATPCRSDYSQALSDLPLLTCGQSLTGSGRLRSRTAA